MTRLLAIGDIHGQYRLLKELLGVLVPAESDQFVFLGDYIDRGPDTPAVIDLLIEFQQRYPKTVFLRGNHEQMLLDAIASVRNKESGQSSWFDDYRSLGTAGLPGPVYYFLACGGLPTLQAYSGRSVDIDPCRALETVPDQHLDFFERTEFYYQAEQFFFVHAGVDPSNPTGVKDNNQTFLWERRPLWKKSKCWNKTVVHGHTPVEQPYISDLEINLDTGAGHGGCLTACDVLTGKSWRSCH